MSRFVCDIDAQYIKLCTYIQENMSNAFHCIHYNIFLKILRKVLQRETELLAFFLSF
jgi:hypothetical protein